MRSIASIQASERRNSVEPDGCAKRACGRYFDARQAARCGDPSQASRLGPKLQIAIQSGLLSARFGYCVSCASMKRRVVRNSEVCRAPSRKRAMASTSSHIPPSIIADGLSTTLISASGSYRAVRRYCSSSSIRIRWAAPVRSSYCPARSAQKNAASPTQASSSAAGIRITIMLMRRGPNARAPRSG